VISYGLAIAAGMYSQPLTIFPVLAQFLQARRPALISALVAIGSYLPWYAAQRQVQVEYAQLVPPTPLFSLKQIDPRILLHDLTGSGYVTTAVLIGLAIWGLARKSRFTLLAYSLIAAVIGPILMDAVFNYFFAPRQVLYAMPVLVLLAAQRIERLRTEARSAIAWALVAIFFSAAVVANYKQATTPRDDLAGTADAMVLHLKGSSCVVAAPPEQIAFYMFFQPELQEHVCPPGLVGEIISATSQYTTPAERQAFVDSVSRDYQPLETEAVGQSRITTYRRR
jgi:hypothetical protein